MEALEKVTDITLSREGYDQAYKTEMPELLHEIFKKSTLIFASGDYFLQNCQNILNYEVTKGMSLNNRKRKEHAAEHSCQKALGYYEEALNYYNKYPHKYPIQRADIMRKLADAYCLKSKKFHHDNFDHCYRLLADAYYIYRKKADLHGIADVLFSIGEAEESMEICANRRSARCFYKTAADIYKSLGDNFSYKVSFRGTESPIPEDPCSL